MTVRVDWTAVDQPPITLSLAQTAGGYIVWDQSCRYYVLAPVSLTCALNFMQEGARRGDWLIDDASVERATWGYSVRVDALSERSQDGLPRLAGDTVSSDAPGPSSRSESASLEAGETAPSWDDGNSPASNADNVYPIGRKSA